MVTVTFRLRENERLKWEQQNGGKWGDHGSTPASAGALRGSVSSTCTDGKIWMFCRIRYLLRHTYSENYETQSSKGPYEKPAGAQQTYPPLLKGAGQTEDILLLSRDV